MMGHGSAPLLHGGRFEGAAERLRGCVRDALGDGREGLGGARGGLGKEEGGLLARELTQPVEDLGDVPGRKGDASQ